MITQGSWISNKSAITDVLPIYSNGNILTKYTAGDGESINVPIYSDSTGYDPLDYNYVELTIAGVPKVQYEKDAGYGTSSRFTSYLGYKCAIDNEFRYLHSPNNTPANTVDKCKVRFDGRYLHDFKYDLSEIEVTEYDEGETVATLMKRCDDAAAASTELPMLRVCHSGKYAYYRSNTVVLASTYAYDSWLTTDEVAKSVQPEPIMIRRVCISTATVDPEYALDIQLSYSTDGSFSHSEAMIYALDDVIMKLTANALASVPLLGILTPFPDLSTGVDDFGLKFKHIDFLRTRGILSLRIRVYSAYASGLYYDHSAYPVPYYCIISSGDLSLLQDTPRTIYTASVTSYPSFFGDSVVDRIGLRKNNAADGRRRKPCALRNSGVTNYFVDRFGSAIDTKFNALLMKLYGVKALGIWLSTNSMNFGDGILIFHTNTSGVLQTYYMTDEYAFKNTLVSYNGGEFMPESTYTDLFYESGEADDDDYPDYYTFTLEASNLGDNKLHLAIDTTLPDSVVRNDLQTVISDESGVIYRGSILDVSTDFPINTTTKIYVSGTYKGTEYETWKVVAPVYIFNPEPLLLRDTTPSYHKDEVFLKFPEGWDKVIEGGVFPLPDLYRCTVRNIFAVGRRFTDSTVTAQLSVSKVGNIVNIPPESTEIVTISSPFMYHGVEYISFDFNVEKINEFVSANQEGLALRYRFGYSGYILYTTLLVDGISITDTPISIPFYDNFKTRYLFSPITVHMEQEGNGNMEIHTPGQDASNTTKTISAKTSYLNFTVRSTEPCRIYATKSNGDIVFDTVKKVDISMNERITIFDDYSEEGSHTFTVIWNVPLYQDITLGDTVTIGYSYQGMGSYMYDIYADTDFTSRSAWAFTVLDQNGETSEPVLLDTQFCTSASDGSITFVLDDDWLTNQGQVADDCEGITVYRLFTDLNDAIRKPYVGVEYLFKR